MPAVRRYGFKTSSKGSFVGLPVLARVSERIAVAIVTARTARDGIGPIAGVPGYFFPVKASVCFSVPDARG